MLAALVCVFLVGAVVASDPPHDPTLGPSWPTKTQPINCVDCHSTHGATAFGGFVPQGSGQTSLCASCHNATGEASNMINIGTEVHGNATSGPTLQCTACHDVHKVMKSDGGSHSAIGGADATDNLSLIRNNPQKHVPTALLTMVYQVQGDHLAFNTATEGTPANGVCQTCHTSTGHATNDGTDPHHEGIGSRNCVSCHGHADGFEPSGGGGGCTGCHGSTQGDRREIVSEFSETSHHVTVAIDDATCEVCHDQSTHKSGVVRLKKVNGGGTVALSDISPLGSYVDPLTNPDANIDTFCLDCHTGSGDPFSDGNSPPSVSTASWNASVHGQSANATCYGNGSAAGCHSSGHGSKKTKMLSPFGTGVNTNNVNIEEGLCYGCHDSNGPATSNIQGDFAATTHHLVNNGEHNGNGRDAECETCHGDRHYISASPARGTSNAASGLIASAPKGIDKDGNVVTSITYEYELCFLCHSNYAGSGNNPGDGGAASGANVRLQFSSRTESGTATGGSKTTLVVSGAGWTTNAMAGWPIYFYGGDADGNTATITGNTSNTITFSPGLTRKNDSIAAGDQFRALGGTSHPVIFPQSNFYCTKTSVNGNIATMESPWNQGTNEHNTMWCSDCHKGDAAAGPHGSNNSRMLVAGLAAVDTGGDGKYYTPLCVTCHKHSVYVGGAGGSRFTAHNNSNHTKEQDYNNLYGGCLTCHFGGGTSTTVNLHGSSDASEFMNGNSITNWSPGSCSVVNGGGSTCGGHTKGY